MHRSDSSGTTNIFTGYLSEVSTRVGRQPWARARKSSGRPASAARATTAWPPWSSSKRAASATWSSPTPSSPDCPWRASRTKAGNFVTPTLETTSAAADGATFPADLRFSVIEQPQPRRLPHRGRHLDPRVRADDRRRQGGRPQGLAHLGRSPTAPPRRGVGLRSAARFPERTGPRQSGRDKCLLRLPL